MVDFASVKVNRMMPRWKFPARFVPPYYLATGKESLRNCRSILSGENFLRAERTPQKIRHLN